MQQGKLKLPMIDSLLNCSLCLVVILYAPISRVLLIIHRKTVLGGMRKVSLSRLLKTSEQKQQSEEQEDIE
jgi:hypothetical protein